MNNNIFILLFARFVSLLADGICIIVLSIIFAEKGGSNYLTIFWLIRLSIPSIMAFIAGSIVDKSNHKFVLMIIEAVKVMSLISILFLYNVHDIYLFIFTLIFYSLSPFISSSINPMITIFTPIEERHRVNSYRSTIASVAYILGPIIGSILLSFSTHYIFIFQIICFSISLFTIFFIKYEYKRQEFLDSRNDIIAFKSIKKDIILSLKKIFHTSILKSIIILDCIFVSLSVSIDTYEIIFLKESFGIQSNEYSFIISYSGLSFVLAGIINAKIFSNIKVHSLLKIGLIVTIFSYLLFVFSPLKIFIYISLFILGFGYTTFTTSISTIIQNQVSVDYQGRVWSIMDALPQISTLFSILIVNFFINDVGVLPTFKFIGFILSIFLIYVIYTDYRKDELYE